MEPTAKKVSSLVEMVRSEELLTRPLNLKPVES